eukprot:3266047-Rhodomonas_salina.1
MAMRGEMGAGCEKICGGCAAKDGMVGFRSGCDGWFIMQRCNGRLGSAGAGRDFVQHQVHLHPRGA